MKCTNDGSEMEQGVMDPKDVAWISKKNFAGKVLSFGRNFSAKMRMGITLWAYRCPKCGKVELTTEVK